MNAGPTYYVEREPFPDRGGEWRILRVFSGWNTGTVVGRFSTRADTMATARLLARRGGRVTVVKGAVARESAVG